MADFQFELGKHKLHARASGVLWWKDLDLLCISDMHLGKSERLARNGGSLLPPFETHDTLSRLGEEISALNPKIVICLGDSFDDLKALDQLNDADHKRLTSLIAGREWIWIEGNHDAGPVDIGGMHVQKYELSGITFCHIATNKHELEISGHYHPKARVSTKHRGISRPCFLVDHRRVVMPAFGTYTGGLNSKHSELEKLMDQSAIAVLTGRKAVVVPMH